MNPDVHEIPELDKKGLREFGIVTGSIVAVLFGMVLPYLFDRGWPLWPWILAGILVAWGLLLPLTLRPVYRVWMRIGMLIGRVMTPVILTLAYVIAFIPTAIILRLSGKDPMRRKFDDSSTYRVPSKPPSVENMEKPY